MRLTAIVLASVATLTLAGGIFGYWLGAAFICFDVCPPAATFTPTWLRMLAIFLGPGLLLSIAASITGVLSLRAEGRGVALIIAVVAPIIAIVALALVMQFVAGSFTPLVNAGPPEVAPADRQLSQVWLGATNYAVIPLIIWPIAALLTALIRPPIH